MTTPRQDTQALKNALYSLYLEAVVSTLREFRMDDARTVQALMLHNPNWSAIRSQNVDKTLAAIEKILKGAK